MCCVAVYSVGQRINIDNNADAAAGRSPGSGSILAGDRGRNRLPPLSSRGVNIRASNGGPHEGSPLLQGHSPG